ncbi:MAG: hypothetical protein KHW59_00145 [Clostridiales bacterium]|nr:hypothetical protein [Clostridiales bacterium]
MKSIVLRKGLPFLLACVIAVMPLCTPAYGAAEQKQTENAEVNTPETEINTKAEVVYGVLDANGTVKSLYTVNRLELDTDGTFTDYGNYSVLTNLTSTDLLMLEGDAITGSGSAGDFYYQGNMESTDLPWLFALSYTLDTSPIDIAELSGASGALEIHFSTQQNKNVNSTFYDHYMLQVTFTLDMELCKNISAEGGTVSEAGTNKMITYTVFPGRDADLFLRADVENFSMTGVDIAAVPYTTNMEIPDADELTDGFQQLDDGISALHDGVSELLDGIQALDEGSGALQSGSTAVKDGLAQLDNSAYPIVSGSAEIQKALEQISSGLQGNGTEAADTAVISQLPAGLSAVAGGLRQMAQGLSALKDGFSPALNALDTAMEGIPAPALSEEELASLYLQVAPEQYATLDTLIGTYTAAAAAKGTYTQIKTAFDSITETLTTISEELTTVADTLDSLATETEAIPDMLSALSEGISNLAENYASFHQGLTDYTNAVSEFSTGYEELDAGITSAVQGIASLEAGVQDLYDGTDELNKSTSGMAEEVQSAINSMTEEYLGSDFEMVSFASEKNTNVSLVQFVLKLDGIAAVQEEVPAQLEEEPQTLLDRLAALFTKKEN